MAGYHMVILHIRSVVRCENMIFNKGGRERPRGKRRNLKQPKKQGKNVKAEMLNNMKHGKYERGPERGSVPSPCSAESPDDSSWPT